MSGTLPLRPSLEWLKKTAKQQLRSLRAARSNAKLADAQLELARHYGFPSWRALQQHVVRLEGAADTAAQLPDEDEVAAFLREVGAGQIDTVREHLARLPRLLDLPGPHPYWGGRPQALHICIETKRRDMFDLLLEHGASVDGNNEGYDHWSPLMLAIQWQQQPMRDVLIERGATIGLLEALLLGDDSRVANLLRVGQSALPNFKPNGGSILALARTPFAIDRLLELGATRDEKDRWDTTPIEAMSRLGEHGRKLVAHMRSHGIQAEPQAYARMGDRQSLEALLANDRQAAIDDAVLVGAVDFSHHDLVLWLLDNGASANARAKVKSGQTVLHSAAWNGDLHMVKLLVAAGADTSAVDDEHANTPRGWAEVSLQVSNNPDCAQVARFLADFSAD